MGKAHTSSYWTILQFNILWFFFDEILYITELIVYTNILATKNH